jgi:hypothetical protein
LVDYKGSSLFTVKRRESDGLLGIDFDVYDPKGKKVATVPDQTNIGGIQMSGNIIDTCQVGIKIA